MPTERFLNLPQEKRERILAAAEEEFSRVPFEEVSINKIVRTAQIPRGSFYQYFEGKNDLLCYLMQDYHEMVVRRTKELVAQGEDIFSVLSCVLATTVEYGMQKDRMALCKNVFAHLRAHEEKAYELVNYDAQSLLDEFLPHLNLKQLRFSARQDMLDMLDILASLLRRALATVFVGNCDWPEAQKKLDNQLRMIKQGLLMPEGNR